MSTAPPFLNVKNSLTGRKWVARLSQNSERISDAMAQRHGISLALARILAGRDIALDQVEGFLNPQLRHDMPDPNCLLDMEILVDRLYDAIIKNQSITLFGDYDVDGATSCACLKNYLLAIGSDASIYIPDRFREGYGPNIEAITTIKQSGADLLITIDCGVTSFDALSHAKTINLDALVIDHHLAALELPPAIAIVNPNRMDDTSGLDHLCAAGLAFMVIVALNRKLRKEGYFSQAKTEPNLMSYLDVVALGTVADIVSLQGLNRTFVLRGLEVMRQRQNQGLAALCDISRVNGPVTAYDLGFLLGPRINAGGRIGQAELGADLLTNKDNFKCQEIAQVLDDLNKQRQAIEADIVQDAVIQAENLLGENQDLPVLVVTGQGWHQGVVGLVASRLKERFRRPVFALAVENDLSVGSGRSVPGVDIGSAVKEAVSQNILVKGGGHKMAAGLTCPSNNIGQFRAFMIEQLSNQVNQARSEEVLKIDAALSSAAANIDLLQEIEKAGPYGNGNPSPIFAFPSHHIHRPSWVGKGHLKFSISSPTGKKNNAYLDAIGFRLQDTELGAAIMEHNQAPFHLVGTIKANYWQGQIKPQLSLIDAVKTTAL